jgi:ABC-type transporter MlaC component
MLQMIYIYLNLLKFPFCMKSLLLIIILSFTSLASYGQIKESDTLATKEIPLEEKDSVEPVPIELEEVYITNQNNFKSADERKQYLILQRRVIRVYPYAKIAAERLTALDEGMKGLTSERDKKKYFKIVENYLTNEFEEQLKKLSRKDGQILVKLIHRQTGSSTYELIKELKSGWKAFWSNNTAKLFDINLKTKFQPYTVSEDFIIESILYKAFVDGRLVKQPSKVPMNYSELAKIWRARLKEIRDKREQEAKNQSDE